MSLKHNFPFINQCILFLSLILVLHVWRNFGEGFCPPPSWGCRWDTRLAVPRFLLLVLLEDRSDICSSPVFRKFCLLPWAGQDRAGNFWFGFPLSSKLLSHFQHDNTSMVSAVLEAGSIQPFLNFKIFGFEITHNTVKSNTTDKNKASFL